MDRVTVFVIFSAYDLLTTLALTHACVQHHHYLSRPFIRPIPRSEATLDVATTLPSPSPPPYNLGEKCQLQKLGFYIYVTQVSNTAYKAYDYNTNITPTYYERYLNTYAIAILTTRTSLFLFVLGDIITIQILQLLQTTISGLASGLRALYTCIQAPIHIQIDYHSYTYHLLHAHGIYLLY